MTVDEFKTLKKLMSLATSPNDAEALAAFRRATAMLAAAGYTWPQALDRVIKVVPPVEAYTND